MTSGPMDERRWALNGAQARRVHDALWALGDNTRVAGRLTALSTAVVEAAELRGGQEVLDIGAGDYSCRSSASRSDDQPGADGGGRHEPIRAGSGRNVTIVRTFSVFTLTLP
jgi:hypothetical protein